MPGGAIDPDTILRAKVMGFPDAVIARFAGTDAKKIKDIRKRANITAAFKMVDTCAAEFAASTPYYYSCYASENEVDTASTKKKVLVLGSGPIRIGQGIEFDYCSVHCVWALQEEGFETIIVNNNPETVSTDFDIADKLYFEPLTPEDIENIVELEKPYGAVVQFGGQTAINLIKSLMEMGVKILGTQAQDVDNAEDRECFDRILEECGNSPPGGRHGVYNRGGPGGGKPHGLSGFGAPVLRFGRPGHANCLLRRGHYRIYGHYQPHGAGAPHFGG